MVYCDFYGQSISRLVLGTDYYGTVVDKKTAFKMYDSFMELGGNNFDTAHMYTDGLSETILGSWVRTQRRDKVFIATKGGQPRGESIKARLSEKELREDIEQSLKRSGLEYFDMYWLHRDDTDIPAEEVIVTLNKFIKEGKTKHIGCSNWRCDRINTANTYATENGYKGFTASQIKWSLARTAPNFKDDPTLVEMDDREFSCYAENTLKLFAYASQGKGFFPKYLSGGESALSPKARERYLCEENIKRFNAAERLSKEKNVGIASIALAYLLSVRNFDVFPVIGCKTQSQLYDSIESADVTLTQEELNFLDG